MGLGRALYCLVIMRVTDGVISGRMASSLPARSVMVMSSLPPMSSPDLALYISADSMIGVRYCW